MITYDLEKRSFVKERTIGLTGQISFQRLAKLFADSGEITPNEKIKQFTIDDHGMIQYTVETI